jgi:arylsulfatase
MISPSRFSAALIAFNAILTLPVASVSISSTSLRAGEELGRSASAASSPVLPVPPAPFQGTINLRAADSKPDFPQPVRAPAGAPNILVVFLDDVGYGAASTFGGPCNTPTLTKVAENGLKYNHFHTTALCSPTRAALLTGRNHHSAHTSCIMEAGTGFPGYDTVMGKETATLPKC